MRIEVELQMAPGDMPAGVDPFVFALNMQNELLKIGQMLRQEYPRRDETRQRKFSQIGVRAITAAIQYSLRRGGLQTRKVEGPLRTGGVFRFRIVSQNHGPEDSTRTVGVDVDNNGARAWTRAQ